jgi:hypothetical protein
LFNATPPGDAAPIDDARLRRSSGGQAPGAPELLHGVTVEEALQYVTELTANERHRFDLRHSTASPGAIRCFSASTGNRG